MDKAQFFDVAQKSSIELRWARNPTESSTSKCASEKAKVGCFGYFDCGKVDKNVLSTRIERKTNVSEGKLNRWILLGNCNDILEVLGKGTKLMKSLNYPTIIGKLQTGNLWKSTMYHAILEIETKEYKHKVPAVMFSNPYATGKTKLAEVLPLSFVKSVKSSICLAPMMARNRYQSVIRRGFYFKIISLIPGGAFDGPRENPWNMYDIRITALRNQLRKFLEKDVNQMALLLGKVMLPRADFIACRRCLQKYATPGQITFSSTWIKGTGKEENPQGKGRSKRSKFSTNEMVPKEFNSFHFQNFVDPNEQNQNLEGGSISTCSIYQLNGHAENEYVSDII